MSDPEITPSTPEPVSPVPSLEGMSATELQQWKLTGELPSTPPSTADTDSSPVPPVEQAASTDATPPPASEPGTGKGKALKARTAELDTEIAELETRLRRRAQLREELSSDPVSRPPDARTAGSSPAPVDTRDPEPEESDPKYAGDYSLFLVDKAAWAGRKAARDEFGARERAAKEQQDRQRAREEHQRTVDGFKRSIDAARAKYPDFDAKALDAPSPIRAGSPIDVYVMESPMGAEVLYHLNTRPEEVARLDALPVVEQLRELVKLETSLQPAPVKTISGAPDPGRTLGTKPQIDGDPATAALQRGDFTAYRAEMNRREVAARK